MDYNKKMVTELWQEHEPYIRRLCTYKLKSLPDYVDDCIQDVFLYLSDAINKGKTIEYPKAWLTKVANNKIKDILHKPKKMQKDLSLLTLKILTTLTRVSFTMNILQLKMSKFQFLKKKLLICLIIKNSNYYTTGIH